MQVTVSADTEVSGRFFRYADWATRLADLRDTYAAAEPFPHIVIDDFFDPDKLSAVLDDFARFKSDNWINYSHVNERKRGFTHYDEMPGLVRDFIAELNSPAVCEAITKLTGIPALLPDFSLEGGGMHESREGGYLNIHADFESHPHRTNWRRQVNLLVFLNKDWDEAWGGQLELWTRDVERCAVRLAPLFNRMVVFTTDDTSYHGHPDPLRCPPATVRRSIALYYFTDEGAELKVRSTHYRARPGDAGAKRLLIELDNLALRGYTKVKRTLGIDDRLTSALLKKLSRR